MEKTLKEKEEVKETKEIRELPSLSQCTRLKNKVKVITRHVWGRKKEGKIESLINIGKIAI